MNRIEFGDCRETMRRWAGGGVKAQMCVTSPPYFGLRDYGHEGQIGLEQTPEEYIAAMVDVFRCVRDVLADDGTLWLNIGDSYGNDSRCQGGASSKQSSNRGTLHEKTHAERYVGLPDGIKRKDLIGIPWMLAFALRADGWYLRQDIIWHKPNPMPESVRDRCTKAHEYMFLLSKSERYFFDSDAMKEPAVKGASGSEFHTGKTGAHQLGRASIKPRKQNSTNDSFVPGATAHGGLHREGSEREPETRNRRSVWSVATRPYKGAHFATFPPALIEPCILAGTSERGHCPECGARWVREVEVVSESSWAARKAAGHASNRGGSVKIQTNHGATHDFDNKAGGFGAPKVTRQIGWTPTCTCGCDPVPDTVLDPFMGSGTTAAVALQHGRQYLGCELNPDYGLLQQERIAGATPAPVAQCDLFAGAAE